MRHGHAAAVGLFTAALLVLGGCADSKSGEVAGTVSFDGTPIEDGRITFTPADGKSSTAGGKIENGKYAVSGVPLGKSKVSISGSKVIGQKALYAGPNSPTAPVTIDPIPKKYNDNTELTFDVQSGRNEKDWELKSK